MTPTPEQAQARAAKIAGALYLITNATAAAGIVLRSRITGSGDAATIAQNILNGERLYRVSIALDLATVCGVVVLVWALYVLLRPVNRDLALLAVFFRLMEDATLALTNLALMVGLRIVERPEYLNAFDASQLNSLARLARGSHDLGFEIGFLFLGVGQAVFAYVLLKSRYVPAWLAGWGVFASLLFAICFLLMIVFPGAGQTLQIVAFVPMGIYEVGAGAWLLLKGVNLSPARQDFI